MTSKAHRIVRLCRGISLVGLLGFASAGAVAAPQLLGPSPYLAFDNTLPGAGTAISPFSGHTFTWFHLETFEDHLFNVPGVSADHGGVTSVVFGPSIHDSVDADDGHIDGSGLQGDDFFSSDGSTGITFTFDKNVLGALPTHAGIVWTDGGLKGAVTFKAFGPGGLLVSHGPDASFADASNNGETAEDRFFGVIDPNGISSIFISNTGGGIEVDHLQYGLAAPVPLPASAWLFGAAFGGLISRVRRRARA